MSTTALTKVGTKNAEQVVLLDAAGDQVTSFGGGTQYADGAAAATPTGTQINWNDGGTQRAVSAAKPLPVTASIDTTGLATSTIQTDGTQKTQIVDSGGEAATVTGGKLDVNASIDTTGLATAANQQTDALTDTELRATPVPVSATDLDIRNLTATDVVTANLSATDNAVLDSIDTSTAAINTKTPALGQALAAASVPVVLPAAQITTLTPPAAITGFALEATLGSVKTAVETIDNFISGSRGLVTEDNSAAIKTSVELIDDTVATTASAIPSKGIAVSGTDGTNARVLKTDTSGELQVDVLTMPTVTVTATNLDVQSGGADLATSTQAGAIQTAVELIDDTVKVLGTDTYTEAATKGLVIGAVRRDADSTLVDTTNEIGPVQMNAAGQLKVEVFSGETLPVSLTSTTVTGTVAVTQSGTWDEVGINDSGNSITVDYATTGSGTATGALRVELPTNGTGVIATVGAVTAITNALPAGTNAIGKLAANSGVDIGDVDVTSVIAGVGATNLGKAEDAAHTAGDTGVAILERRIDTAATSADTSGDYATANQSAEGASWATLTPTTTSGCTIFRSLDLDESEEEIKATAGNLYGYYFFNATASVRYLKFYNATAANVTVGTTTPVLTFGIPASAAGHVAFPYPIGFGTAITAAVTTAAADADTGAPGAGDIIFNCYFK